MKGEILKKDIVQKEIITIKYNVNKNFKPMLKRLSKLLLQIGYKESSVKFVPYTSKSPISSIINGKAPIFSS